MLATLKTELQELVDRLDQVRSKYNLLINVDKTKVMASDGIEYRILIQNKQLEQVDTFPYLGSLITENGACMMEFSTRLKGAGDRGIIAENTKKSHSIPISTKI